MSACVIDGRRRPTDGLLCARHYVEIGRMLDVENTGTPGEQLQVNPERVLPSIPVLYRELDASYARRELGSQVLSGVFGSRPPADLHVLALRDPRSRVDGHGPDDHDRNPPLPVLTELWGIVTQVDRTDIDGVLEQRPERGVEAVCAWLHTRRDWISQQPWVDTAYDTLRALTAQLRGAGANGDPATRPLNETGCTQLVDIDGTTYLCATPLYFPDQLPKAMDEPIRELPAVRCTFCGHTYTQYELVRLGQQRWEERAQAAS